MVIKLIMVNQTLAVTVERYIAVCRPHQHLGLVTVLISSCFIIVIFLLLFWFVNVTFKVDLINTLALTCGSLTNWKLSSQNFLNVKVANHDFLRSGSSLQCHICAMSYTCNYTSSSWRRWVVQSGCWCTQCQSPWSPLPSTSPSSLRWGRIKYKW